MNILAIDSSAKTASIAITQNGVLISEAYVNIGLTHSETLLPMLQSALQNAKMTLADMDALAVTNGPGSFTGIRIGIAALKGLAMPRNLPCAGVSTLEAMAYQLQGRPCIACCVMDARCRQVYSALFSCGETVERLTPDAALPLSALPDMLKPYTGQSIVLIGDGAGICRDYLHETLPQAEAACALLQYQRAAGAAFAAEKQGLFLNAEELQPVYLRLPQAERELKRMENA